MPLHDWTDRDNFDGFHTYWMTEIAVLLRHTLPPPYQVLLGSSPRMAIGGTRHRPDVGVANGTHPHTPTAAGAVREPDAEVPVATLDEELTVQVERNGRLVAAIEFISPRNKDRPDSRDYYTTRYLSYLHHGVHLLLVDVHRRPLAFSFPQRFATELETELPACEAAACGCPLLLSDLPWARCTFGSAATYCPVTSVPETAEVMQRFYRMAPTLPAPPRPPGWAEVAASLEQIYASLLRGPSPAAG